MIAEPELPAVELPAEAGLQPRREWRRIAESVLRNPIGLAGLVVVALTVAVALLGPLAWRVDPSDQQFHRLLPPSPTNPMGTDQLGRDTLARMIHGSLVSLEVGLVSVLIAVVLGTAIGLAAAYHGRAVDAILMRIVDIMFAFPGLVLAIMIAGLLGPSRRNALIAIGIVYAPAFARVVRGSSLSVIALPYVEAARALGAGSARIIGRHLLPNILPPLIVLTTIYLSAAILTEASLSFLGLGTQPPEPSWGGMLNESRRYMQIAPWLAIFPGLGIMAVVLGFNFLGDGLRDVLDPRMGDA